MSNEYKMLNCPFCGEPPIITKHHREEMYNFIHRCEVLGPISRDFREDPMAHVEMWNTRFAAAPQPPALGGEPEPIAWLYQDGTALTIADAPDVAEHIRDPEFGGDDIQKLIKLSEHRAHLAPLQAEIERHKYKAELYDEVWRLATGLGYLNVTTAISELRKERDQLMARCDEQAKALSTLINVARTVNRNAASATRVPGDDEPQYRQRKEWIDYLLETCAEAEALSKPAGSEKV